MNNMCNFLNYIYKVTNLLIINIDSINIIKINKIKKEYLQIIYLAKKLLKKCNGIKDNISIIDKIRNKIHKKEKILNNLVKILEEINIKEKEYNIIDKEILELSYNLKKTVLKNIMLVEKYYK